MTLLQNCAVISCNLDTVERILSGETSNGLPPVTRARKVIDLFNGINVDSGAALSLRYGRKNAEYCLDLSSAREAELWQYDVSQYGHSKGSQDRLFVHEITRHAERLPRTRLDI